MNDTDWRPLAAGLAETVARKVRLSPQWRAAFEEVPRHHFVSGAPLQKVYADEPIVIQRDDEHGSDRPTSWATAPSLLAYMLMLLHIEGGRTVLEIGTGSGYNTALLAHRLGSGSVTSEEIDSDLRRAAQIRLSGIGYKGSHLYNGDGRTVIRLGLTFDRIIATIGARRIPAAWGEQLDTDGVLVSDFGDGALARVVSFSKALNGSLRGRFHERISRFMPVRPDVPASGDDPVRPYAKHRQGTVERLDELSVPREILDEPFAGLAAAVEFFLGPELVSGRLPDGSPGCFMAFGGGAWIEIPSGGAVSTGGARPLAQELEAIATQWRELGRPDVEDLRLVVGPDGSHALCVYGFDYEWSMGQSL